MARSCDKINPIGSFKGLDMNRFNLTLLPTFAALLLSSAAQATTVNLAFSNGSLLNTAGISTFDVTGADMVGLGVTACFTVGACQTLVWQSAGTTAGGVTGTNWSLALGGDSFVDRFILRVNLSNSSLTSLSLDGRPGLTAFDVTPDVSGSPGSAVGRPFSLQSGPGATVVGNLDVTYSDKLAVGGVFYDDLYTVMTMNFRGGTGFVSGRMEFSADTDKTSNGATIDPNPGNTVPTPATLALVGLGLLGLAANTRRKARC